MKGKNSDLKTHIYNIMRDRIIYIHYQPGQALNEKDLCAEFKTSRTPLREAVLKLQDHKLVRIIPRFGTSVEDINLLEIRDLYTVKKALEGLAVELAVDKAAPQDLNALQSLLDDVEEAGSDVRKLTIADQEFHRRIHSLTHNRPLQEMLDSINARCARGWIYYSLNFSSGSETIDTVKSLELVYRAMKTRSGSEARLAMEKHVGDFIDKLRRVLL